jgi:RHS repeat-associated protein
MGAAPYAGTPSLLYDDENRLVEARDADAAFAVLGSYVYDAFGRRVKKVAAGKTELFFYDLAGHTLEILEVKAGTDHVRDLVWVEDEPMGFVDQDVEVGTAEAPGGIPWRMPAVPLGVALGGAVMLVLLSLPAVRRRPRAAAAGLTLAVVVTAVGVARSQGGGAAFYWIHTDHLGTPLAVTNTPGTPSQATAVWRAAYTPFGEAAVDEDPDGDLALVSLSLRFPGQLHDPETGLHDNYFRYFDPTIGRYISADPIGQSGGISLYRYARNNPLRYVDPYGLWPFGLPGRGTAEKNAPSWVDRYVPELTDSERDKLVTDALDEFGWGDVNEGRNLFGEQAENPPKDLSELTDKQKDFVRDFLKRIEKGNESAAQKCRDALNGTPKDDGGGKPKAPPTPPSPSPATP